MPVLSKEGCLTRQHRMRERMQELQIDAVFISDLRDIYYFTGLLLHLWPACLMLGLDGSSWLAAYAGDETACDTGCVGDCVTYESHLHGTYNPDNMLRLSKAVTRCLDRMRPVHRVGWQVESMPMQIAATVEHVTGVREWAAVDEVLAELQARKDPDEVEMIRASILADLAAYTAAQAAIKSGVSELEVLAAGQGAAMLAAGEGVYHNGDYRSGALGGPARNRAIERGELFIVDAQTVYRGYWCDLSRTYVVGGEPTELQQSIHDHIASIQRDVVGMLKPGVQGTQLWRALDERLREHPALSAQGLTHHAGHGVGLRAHEAPDLNRDREGVLAPGNVVSVEPGGYIEAVRAGVRLENMYLITETGAQIISDYPMNLVPQRPSQDAV